MNKKGSFARLIPSSHLAAMLLGLLPSAAQALGLGDIEVESVLHQPLRANIAVIGLDDLDPESITIRMADAETFEQAGIDKPAYLNRVRFQWGDVKDGNAALQLTTNQSVVEPYLNFLLEMAWPEGKIIREYTLLLDPPLYDELQPSVVRAPQMPRLPEPMQEIAPPALVKPASNKQLRHHQPPQHQPLPHQSLVAGSKYKTKAGDSLWVIAEQASIEQGVTLPEMMHAIIKNNRHAFARADGSLMYQQVTLTIPSVLQPPPSRHELAATTVSAVPTEAHLRLVVPQNANSQPEESAVTADAPTEAQLTDQAESQAEGKVEQLNQDLMLVKEALTTHQRENEVLQAELALVNKQVESLRALLELKQAEVASLSQAPLIKPTPTVAKESAKPIKSASHPRWTLLHSILVALGLVALFGLVRRRFRRR